MTNSNDQVAYLLNKARTEGATALDEAEGKSIMREFGVATPRGEQLPSAPTSTQIDHVASRLAPPWVVKILANQPVHKSELGAVHVGLDGVSQLTSAITDMSQTLDHESVGTVGYLVEEMAPAGVELIVGGHCDARLGPVVTVGLGGTFVEIFEDVTSRICPIDRFDAEAMLDELLAAPLLHGVRGGPPMDKQAIVQSILAVAGPEGLMTRHAGLVHELDINPLIASPNGAVAADVRIVLGERHFGDSSKAVKCLPEQDFSALFAPQNIAVVGASATTVAPGNRYLRALRSYGFAGDIFPIHPTAEMVEGLRAFPSLADTPTPVDYAYIAVAAPRVADVLDASNNNVRFAQIIASGFSEATADDALEQQLLQTARDQGTRLLGPNCLGTHVPREKVTFVEGVDRQPGGVGIVSQSGGIGMDVLKRGQALGLRFSTLITIGNSIDVAPHELMQCMLDDEETQVIGLYLEDLKDGRSFLETLQRAACHKPIVVLTGGLTRAGRKAAGSHTGAMTTDDQLWRAIARQTGLCLTTDLDAFLDALLIFQSLPTRAQHDRNSVVLFGNGGGTSVLGSDHLARAGLKLATIPESLRRHLVDSGIPDWVALENPVDIPAVQLKDAHGETAGFIMSAILDGVRPDFLVVHLNLPVILGYRDIPELLPRLVDEALSACSRSQAETHLVLVLRSDGSRECDDARRTYRSAAAANGVPVFDEVDRAAKALSLLSQYDSACAVRQSRSSRSLRG